MPLKRVSVLKRVSFLAPKLLKEGELGWRWAVYICGTNNKNLILWSQFFKRNSVCEMSQAHLMSALVLNRAAKDDFCGTKVHCLKSSATLVPKTPWVPPQAFTSHEIFFMSKGGEERTVYGLTEKTGNSNPLQITKAALSPRAFCSPERWSGWVVNMRPPCSADFYSFSLEF